MSQNCDYCNEPVYHPQHFECFFYSGIQIPENKISIIELDMLAKLGFLMERDKEKHIVTLYASEGCVLFR